MNIHGEHLRPTSSTNPLSSFALSAVVGVALRRGSWPTSLGRRSGRPEGAAGAPGAARPILSVTMGRQKDSYGSGRHGFSLDVYSKKNDRVNVGSEQVVL